MEKRTHSYQLLPRMSRYSDTFKKNKLQNRNYVNCQYSPTHVYKNNNFKKIIKIICCAYFKNSRETVNTSKQKRPSCSKLSPGLQIRDVN